MNAAKRWSKIYNCTMSLVDIYVQITIVGFRFDLAQGNLLWKDGQ